MAARARFRSVVLGVDGSPHSRRAVTFLTRLAAPAGGRVTIVSVVEPVRVPSVPLLAGSARARVAAGAAEVEQALLAGARRRVEAAARELESAGWRTKSSLRSGVPLVEILQAVEDERADLLVLGARGTSGLDRLLLGSIAEGALKRAPVPVLLVK